MSSKEEAEAKIEMAEAKTREAEAKTREAEEDDKRKKLITDELRNLLSEAPIHSLEPKCREAFAAKFNIFKVFIHDLNS